MAVHDAQPSNQVLLFVIARQGRGMSHVPKTTQTHHEDFPSVPGLLGEAEEANSPLFSGFLRARRSKAAPWKPGTTNLAWAPFKAVDALRDKSQ